MNSEIAEVWSSGGLFVFGLAFTLALLIAVIIWQTFKTLRTWLASRGDVARYEDYRSLAERVVAAEEKLAEGQERIGHDLAKIGNAVAEVERLLSEVN
jgi:hypothetical protein